MTTRREFLALSAGAMAAYAAGLKALESAAKPLDILFLGGTGFLGPHQINHALARGHRVTMFNRGSNTGMYGDRVEELVGNRDDRVDAGLSALRNGRSWDVVVDNSGYVPRHVRDSVELLKGRCGRYLYVSTVAVYDRADGGFFPEDGPMMTLDDPAIEEVTGATYGPLKAECDRYVQEALGDAATVVRPCYVVGPGDRSDRFTYWVDRVMRGGEVLAPGGPELNAHLVDARDLCPWIVTLAENDTPGVFNAAGPSTAFSRAGLMWALAAQGDRPVEFFWPSWEMLEESGFNTPMMRVREAQVRYDNAKSMKAGLHYRSVSDSARGTLEWWLGQPDERRANARRWPSPELERQLVERVKSARVG
jgi:2'-hydroxyisoflavone reductase